MAQVDIARIRTAMLGGIFEQDVIVTSEEGWRDEVSANPDLSTWPLAPSPPGLIIAVEPLAKVFARTLGLRQPIN